MLVTHDRCLMDRVATHIIGLGTGCDDRLFADYAQWEAASRKPEKIKEEKKAVPLASPSPVKKKLSFNEQRELQGMPEAIEKAEKELDELQKQLDTGDFTLYQKIASAQSKVEQLYRRWEDLENLLRG